MTATALADLSLTGAIDSASEPPWLTAVRDRSAAFVTEHGYPTRKHEDWRYVKLNALFDVPFGTLPEGTSDIGPDNIEVAELLAEVPDLGGPRLVFVDGRFSHALSRLEPPAAVYLAELSEAIRDKPEMVESHLFTDSEPHGFAALNAALARTGVVVEVEPNASVTEAIHLIHVFSGVGDPVLANLRNLIMVGPGASASLVSSTIGAQDAVGCYNTTTRVHLATDAELTYQEVQDQPLTAYHLGLLDVTQEARSRLSGHTSAIGASIARHEIHVAQKGKDALTDLDAIYLPRGTQQHDHPVLVEHFAIDGESNQVYRGVIDDRGHGVFNGQIIVHPGAVGIAANQSNKNLLLSDNAEADTRPRLEIYADDVQCTHGAVVGQLDEEPLYYLRTRGIDLQEATRILTYAFIEEVVDRLGEGLIHDRVESLVSARLHPDAELRDDSDNS